MRNYDGPSEYRPLGAWSYVGLTILYMIPVIGWIFLIVFTFSGSNINRRSFTRSYWCWLLLSILFFGGSYFLARSEKGEQLAEAIFEKVAGLEILSDKGSLSEIFSSAKSYEEIYYTYSSKIKTTGTSLLEEYKKEADKNSDGINVLAELATSKVNVLAGIEAEGAQKMAKHMLLKGSSSHDDYEKWTSKLYDDYQTEAQKIMDLYMSLATG